MNALEITREKIVIEFSKDELSILINTLNVVCNAIEEWEFQIRTGMTLEEAKKMKEFLSSAYIAAEQCEE